MTSTFKLGRRQLGFCNESEVCHQLLLAAMLLSPACNADMATAPTALPDGTEETRETAARLAPIPISPGESIQAKVNNYPAGTRFLLKAGTYARQSVSPKSGNWFIGEAGTILTGQDTTLYAFRGANGTRNVHIQGLIIERYNSPVQMGAVRADGTIGWVIQGNEIRYNAAAGVRIGDKARVLQNNIHHNHQIGIVGSGESVLVEDNEIAYNNWLQEFPFGFELGGAKFVKTRYLVARGNRVHDNWGNGLWTDNSNILFVEQAPDLLGHLPGLRQVSPSSWSGAG